MTDDAGSANQELVGLIEGDENKSKDYKSATVLREPDGAHRYEIAKQLVAFANRNGGKLIFGVDDSGQLEGKELDEEMSLGTISRVARMQCQPPIEFSYTYYSEDRGQTTNGDAFVVEIEPRRSIPHAIAENSEGEIRKREYRIRAGDESRLLTNEELDWLFQNQLSELGHNYRTYFWVILDEDGDSIAPQPPDIDRPQSIRSTTTLPTGASYLTYFIDKLTDEELDEMVIDEMRMGLTPFIADVTPFSVLMSLARVFRPTWNVEWVQSPSSHQTREYQLVDREISMSTITRDDVVVHNNGLTLSHLGFDPLDRLGDWIDDSDYLLSLPEGSEVIINLDEEPSEFPVISYATPSLVIRNRDVFEFVFECRWDEAGRDYPHGHPDYHRKSSSPNDMDITSIQLRIDYSSEYGVPDVTDPFLEEHQKLGMNLKKVLIEEWDADEQIENRQNEVLFEIDGKLDLIINLLQDSD